MKSTTSPSPRFFLEASSSKVIAFSCAAIMFFSLAARGQTNCAPVPVGIVSWWAGEGNANDSLGSNNGILQGGTGFAAGIVGTAFSFNGTSAYISVPASSSLNVGIGSGLTLEGWIKPADLSRSQIVAEWNDGSGHVGAQLQISNPGFGGLGSIFANLLDVNGADHYFATSQNLLNVSNFQHVAVTYDRASGTAKLYYNGVALVTQNMGVFSPQTSYPLYIGTRISGPGTGEFYSGLLDEFSLYNRALSNSEVQAIYFAGSNGKCSGPLAPLIFSQPTNQTVLIGGTATFTVGASGTQPLSYQWRKTGADIIGATASSYTITGAQTNNAGNYTALVTNNYGAVTSSIAVLTVNPPPPCVPPASGLVSWWRGENNGSDSAGANQAVLGGVGFSGGEVGQAFNFINTTGAPVRIPASSTLNVGTASGFSIEAWINTTDATAQQDLFEWNNGSDYGVHVSLATAPPYGTGPGCLYVDVRDISSADHYFSTPSGAVTSGAWQHVAVTYDKATGNAALYVNGSLLNQQTLGTFTPATSSDLYFGVRVGGPNGPLRYTGLMDEVSLYNRALATSEIVAIYNAGSTGKCPAAAPPTNCAPVSSGLVSSWKGEGNANDSVDSNNGALQGGVAFAPGEVGQAFSLNGTNAYISIPASSNLNVGMSNGFTLECWMNPADVSATHTIAEWNNGSGGIGVQLYHSNPGIGGLGALAANIVSTAGVNHIFASGPNVILPTNFQHIALTYDRNTGLGRLFYNGAVVAAQSLGIFTPQTTYSFYLGNRVSGTASGTFYSGLLDEVSVFNRALATNEVAAIYNAGSAGKCSGTGSPPFIVTQPQNRTVNAGSNVTFFVTANGTPPLSYQWSFNGTNIAFATTTSITLINVQPSQTGNYAVLVTNAFGRAPSSNAFLTVNSNPTGCVAAASGLVSWWSAEGNAVDVVGGNSGILSTNVTFSPGKVGQSFNFDGITASVQVPDAPNLHFTTAMTIEAWINPRHWGEHYREIVSKWEGSTNSRSYTCNITPDGRFNCGLSADGTGATGVPTTSTLPTNAWTHVAAVFDGAVLTVFLNGQSNNSVVFPHTIFPGTAPLIIGSTLFSGSFFDGLIDEPSVYNRALSTSEIAAIYNAGSAGKCTTPVGPSIISQPQSLIVNAGATATFSVTASGTSPLNYQWRKGTNAIGGATASAYTISNVQSSDGGNYSVVVSNTVSSVTSSNASLTVLPQSGTNCAPLSLGLISWWKAEGNGSDSVDSNHALLLNGVGFTNGVVGQAFNFDGIDDRILVSNAPSLNFGSNQNFSIEAWIRPLPSTTDYDIMSVVDKRNAPDLTHSQGYELVLSSGRIACRLSDSIADNGSPFISAGPDLRDGNFHHVVLTVARNSTTGGRLYADGQVVLTFDASLEPGDLSNSDFLRIGFNAVGSINSLFKGQIDEVTLYNRELGTNEIAAIFTAGSAGKCPSGPPPTNCAPASSGLVSWWKAEGDATDVLNLNNGTLYNGAGFASGVVGQAFSLNGTNAHVRVADSPSLHFTNAMTVEVWVYPNIQGNYQQIVTKWNDVGSIQKSYVLKLDPNGVADFGMSAHGDDTITASVTSTNPLPLNQWTHVAGTYDGAAIKIYLNGALQRQVAYNQGIFPGTSDLGIGGSVGGEPLGQAAFCMAGRIDEPSLYGRALSASEIQAIYVAGSAGKCSTGVAPTITSQPQSLTVNAGANATFSVTASGTPPLSYQWRKGTNPIGGATGSAYTISNVQSNDAGNYSVVVSNTINSVTSSNALLTILPLGTNCATVSSGLVGWWKAEANPLDQVGGNNGTLIGNTTYGPGRVGQAFVFDGSGDAVALANSPNLQLQNLTIEAWIQRSSTNRVSFDFNGGEIFSYGHGGYVLGLKDDGHLFLSRVGISEVLGQSITDLAFHHVAVTRNGTNVVFYLDGAASAGSVFTDTFTFSTPPAIGARGDTLQNSFLGFVDEVSVYNRALSTSEIEAIYNASSFGKCPTGPPPTNCAPVSSGLVSWWKGEGNANDSADSNDGALHGATFAPGKVGSAFLFNTNAYVVAAASSNLNVGVGPGLTLEFWMNPFNVSSDHIMAEWNSGAGALGVQFYHSNPGVGGFGALAGNIVSTTGQDHIFASVPGLVTANTFHHVALTYDKTAGIGRLFYDGNAVAVQNMGVFTPQTGYGLYFGTRVSGPPDGLGDYFNGLMDEISLYNRALTTNEIAAIYVAGSGGKCTSPTAPFIVSQPQSQTVTVGANATFSVGAAGTPPLSYQWYFNGSNLVAGATTAFLTISNAQLANAGSYSVLVSNSISSVLSSNAILTVNPGPTLLRVADAGVASGGTVTVPVLLTANGAENALSFSLNFATSKLTYVSTTPANGAGATFFVNESGSATGRLGMALALPAGSTFPPGTQEVAEITFTAAVVTNTTPTTITFVDQPIVRQVSDAGGHILPATYTSGTVSIAGVVYEADVSPRPNGDKSITVTDWVLIGRFAAHLDTPENGSEFQRADCAPRANLGDGRISITDWVQAGRYVAGLDPLTPAGGPTSQMPATAVALKSDAAKRPTARLVLAGGAVLNQGQSGTVSISLRGQGNENALGFTLVFDPSQLTYTGVSLGSAASGASLNVNTDAVSSGQLGLALALSSGANFGVGSNELVKVTFQASVSAANNLSLSFADDPIYREVSDSTANALTADYVSGTIVVNPLPSLRIWAADQGIGLAWPNWATNFVLQQTITDFASPGNWTNVPVGTTITNNENLVIVPIESTARFYRLLKQ